MARIRVGWAAQFRIWSPSWQGKCLSAGCGRRRTGPPTPDGKVRYLQSGADVADAGMAANDRRKGQNGEWIEETTLVDVTPCGRTAQVAGEDLSKGSPVRVEGRLKYDTWEKEGQKRSKLSV